MTRDPSIHVTESKLRGILYQFFPKDCERYEELTEEILTEARKVSCDNRVVSISNEKMNRDIKKILKTGKGDTNLMSTILYSIRKQKKHKGIQRIKEGSKDWKAIKQLAELALDFCNDFEISKREGFIKYIELGFNRMGSYRNHITKLINMYEIICLNYEAQILIDDDSNKEETRDIHSQYVTMIASRTGISDSFENDPINYVNFIKVREITDKYNVPVDVYIESQFEGLEWTTGYPTPSQLTTTKAIDRLNAYMFKNKIKIKVTEDENLGNKLTQMLKKIKDGNYSD